MACGVIPDDQALNGDVGVALRPAGQTLGEGFLRHRLDGRPFNAREAGYVASAATAAAGSPECSSARSAPPWPRQRAPR